MAYFANIGIRDGINLDAFNRLRVSNTTFYSVSSMSTVEYNTVGTISGSAFQTLCSFYATSTKTAGGQTFTQKVPITLDAAGAVRANGTVSVIATGSGGTSACAAALNWVEIR
jgi:hypothetical protein